MPDAILLAGHSPGLAGVGAVKNLPGKHSEGQARVNFLPQSTQRSSRSERDQIMPKAKFKKISPFLGLHIFILLCVLSVLCG
jgi:hypothetical protein